MNSFSDSATFAIVLAINLLLLGALLAGGFAVVLKFTENASPRLRYLVSIALFLTAIALPFAVSVFKHSSEEKASTIVAEPETRQKNEIENLEKPAREVAVYETAEVNLPPEIEDSTVSFIDSVVFALTYSFAGRMFLIVWILGSLGLFLREIIGIRQIRRSKKLWMRADDFEREVLFCPKNIPLYFAADQTPGTVSWLRPAIVLPEEFPVEISLESKRFIVRHELAHARWRDPLVSFILRAVRNIFWISPALWFIEYLMDAEREAAADQAAINASTEEQNSRTVAFEYVETLLSIAEAFNSAKRKNRQLQLVGIGTESNLEIRIRRVLSASRTTRGQLASAVGAGLLTAILMTIIPIASFSKIAEQTDKKSGFVADGENNFPAAENTSNSLLKNNSEILSLTETIRETNTSIKSKMPLKKSVAGDSPSSEETSASKLQARQNISNANYSEANDKQPISANVLSDRDNDEAELRENQQAAAKLTDLESLSPMSKSLGDGSLNSLEKIRPASALKTALADENELPNQKTAVEPAGRQNYHSSYSPATGAAVPKREAYETKYVPYAARRSEQ